MAKLFDTIHIFKFGNVQVIGQDFNHQVKISDVQSEVESCVTMVYNNKPSDSTTTNVYHCISIYQGMFVDWWASSKDEQGFRIDFNNSEMDFNVFDVLAKSIIDLKSTSTP